MYTAFSPKSKIQKKMKKKFGLTAEKHGLTLYQPGESRSILAVISHTDSTHSGYD